MKEKITSSINSIKIKFKNVLNNMDKKIVPSKGNVSFKIINIIKNLWIIVMLPIIILTISSFLNSNTIKIFDMKNISIENVEISHKLYAPAGTIIDLGTVVVQNEELKPTENLFNLNSVGTSESSSIFDKEITGHFIIKDMNDKEVITDGVDGNEVSIYASAKTEGIGVDFSVYEMYVENSFTESYNLNILSTGKTAIMKLTNNDVATLSIKNIDPSWISSDIELWVTLLIISIWFIIFISLLISKRYFSKWKSYVKRGEDE